MNSIKQRIPILRSGYRFWGIVLPFFLICTATATHGKDNATRSMEGFQVSDDEVLLAGEDLGVFGLTLFELMKMEVKVDVASLFMEEDLVIGSSVSVIDSKKWKQAGARNFHQILSTDTFMTSCNFLAGSNSIGSRGFITSSGNTVLLDNIPLGTGSDHTAMFHMPNPEPGALDKIEIIHGPGSAIYGSDAFHGVISMKSFESDEDIYKAEVAAGFPGFGDANIKISHGFGRDLFRIDAVVGMSGQKDMDIDYEWDDTLFNKSGNGTYEDNYKSQTGIVKLKCNPTGRLKISLGSYLFNWDGDNFNSGTYNGIVNLRDFNLSSSESIFYMGNGSITYTCDNYISIQTSLYRWESQRDASYAAMPDEPLSPQIFKSFFKMEDSNERSGARFVIKQPENTFNLQWLFAYEYSETKTTDTDGWIEDYYSGARIPGIGGKAPYDGFSQDVNSAFTQIKWGAFEDSLFFLLGGRLDDYDTFGSQITPRGGVIYLPTENSAIKALYGQGFKAPGSTYLFGNGMAFYGNMDLEPETIDVYELVYMYKGENWKLNLTGFYSYWTNEIRLLDDPDLPPPYESRFVNQGKNKSHGIETELYCKFDRFALDLGFSYAKGRSLDVPVNFDEPSGPDCTRKRSAFPAYITNLAFYYFPGAFSNAQIMLNNTLYFKMSETTYDIDPHADTLPTYWRMDLNISAKLTDRFDIYLSVRNILDRENRMPSIWGQVDGMEQPGINGTLRVCMTF